MKTALVLTLSFAAIAMAQDSKPEEVKHLASVTWDLNTHKLVWVVETGSAVDGEFVPKSAEHYEVAPDEFSMTVQNQKRAVDEKEAVSLHQLLDVLSVYCAESVVWWNRGGGAVVEHVAPGGSQDRTRQEKLAAPAEKPVRVENAPAQRVPASAPPAMRIPGTLVAVVAPAGSGK